MSCFPTVNWLEWCEREFAEGDEKQRFDIIGEMKSLGFEKDAEELIKKYND